MIPNENQPQTGAPEAAAERQPWESMRLRYAGDVVEVVQQGGGKLSNATADPGEPRKTPSSG
jgi:hypothetical protein